MMTRSSCSYAAAELTTPELKAEYGRSPEVERGMRRRNAANTFGLLQPT
jgi:hypothetical protein